jgi:hypothetical protein
MRRNKQPWVDNIVGRMRFEGCATTAYPAMRRVAEGGRRTPRVVYRLIVPVPEYEPRAVELQFQRLTTQPTFLRAYADGPTESPHRFKAHPHDSQSRRSLCMWHHTDPPDMRWVPSDGLLALINHTRIHLFKEAYWRETGEWLGPEVLHFRPEGGKEC